MAGIKQLAGQTLWYGASSIFARFLYYLLTPYFTYKFTGTSQYGEMNLVFAMVPFLYTLILFGFETAYFRFIQKKDTEQDVYNTISTSLFIMTGLITGLTILFNHQLAAFIGIGKHPDYITFAALIIAFDALSAIPFARLRHESKPRKFAFTRIAGILINIAICYFFLSVCPALQKTHPNSVFLIIYNPTFGVGYVLLANVAASFFQVVALSRELFSFRWRVNKELWKQIMIYSFPIMIAGFAGMINETFDRIMLRRWLPVSGEVATYQVGIYSACYKLSILITLFVQAFRMGAEPFFFKQSVEGNAPKVYARVMKFFVITICLMFLFVSLYLDVWKQFIRDKTMWQGLKVVPILLFANMFLGIYYSLSIWYKLSNRTTAGAYITLIGAAITIVINFIFIPHFSYMACAWATFFCYGTMMVVSYIQGQRAYKIPYAWKKLVAYMVIVAMLYFVHHTVTHFFPNKFLNYTIATLFLALFTLFVARIEKKEVDLLLARNK